MNVIGISQRIGILNPANVPDRHYLYDRSRNIPTEREQRGCPGPALRNDTGENRALPAKSGNLSTPGDNINRSQPEGRYGNL